MDKGTHVQIIAGNGKGTSGTIFWTGPDKFRGGLRLGVRGDDGETYWVSEADVQANTAPAAASAAGPAFQKGDRVHFRSPGQGQGQGQGPEGTGTVFWIGESRSGGGQRLGIRDDQSPDDAVWIDARFASPLTDADAAAPPPPRAARTARGPQTPPPPMPVEDLPPPMDDASIDALAAWGPDDGDGGGDDDIPW